MDPRSDNKLGALEDLARKTRGKVLVFSQFADTVQYLADERRERKVPSGEGERGESDDPTGGAWRFSPVSNDKRAAIAPADETRILIATDVLSEGQNLQDCAV